ncbi:MAG: cold shock domain-containing protein [Chitinispirillales bacterium]|nr:cold shock domain-containing protein [Chitinispirillales bacterium]
MRYGTVLWFNDISGTGRIRADEDGAYIGVSHKSILGQGYKILDEGQRVSFDAVKCASGFEARSVVVLD